MDSSYKKQIKELKKYYEDQLKKERNEFEENKNFKILEYDDRIKRL